MEVPSKGEAVEVLLEPLFGEMDVEEEAEGEGVVDRVPREDPVLPAPSEGVGVPLPNPGVRVGVKAVEAVGMTLPLPPSFEPEGEEERVGAFTVPVAFPVAGAEGVRGEVPLEVGVGFLKGVGVGRVGVKVAPFILGEVVPPPTPPAFPPAEVVGGGVSPKLEEEHRVEKGEEVEVLDRIGEREITGVVVAEREGEEERERKGVEVPEAEMEGDTEGVILPKGLPVFNKLVPEGVLLEVCEPLTVPVKPAAPAAPAPGELEGFTLTLPVAEGLGEMEGVAVEPPPAAAVGVDKGGEGEGLPLFFCEPLSRAVEVGMTEDDTVGVKVAVVQGERVGWRGEEEEEEVGGAGDQVPPPPVVEKSTEGVEVGVRGPVGEALCDPPPPALVRVESIVALGHLDTLTVLVMESEVEGVFPPLAIPSEGEEEAVNEKAAVPVVVEQGEGD